MIAPGRACVSIGIAVALFFMAHLPLARRPAGDASRAAFGKDDARARP